MSEEYKSHTQVELRHLAVELVTAASAGSQPEPAQEPPAKKPRSCDESKLAKLMADDDEH